MLHLARLKSFTLFGFGVFGFIKQRFGFLPESWNVGKCWFMSYWKQKKHWSLQWPTVAPSGTSPFLTSVFPIAGDIFSEFSILASLQPEKLRRRSMQFSAARSQWPQLVTTSSNNSSSVTLESKERQLHAFREDLIWCMTHSGFDIML